MAKGISKVVYKPDSTSTDEFIVIVTDQPSYQKWLEGDTTIPLVDFVDSFDVFHTNGQGNQGLLQRPSKQMLDTIFETHKDVDVLEVILKKGNLKPADDLKGYTSKSDSANFSSSGVSGANKGGHGGR